MTTTVAHHALQTFIPITEVVEHCPLCGSGAAETLFKMADRHYDLPGMFAFARCQHCQLVRLSPRPTREQLQYYYPDSDYYSYQAPAPAEDLERPPRAVRGLRERIRANVLGSMSYPVPPQALWEKAFKAVFVTLFRNRTFFGVSHRFPRYHPDGRALDIGCGIGVYLNYLKRYGWQVMGVELNSRAALTAKRLFDIEVFVGELKNVAFQPASFDFIHMNHVIEHMVDPVDQLRVVAELLKPGGRLYIGTPNVESLNRKRSGPHWIHWDPPRHLHLFSPETLRLALHKAGLVVTSLRTAIENHYIWEDTYRREEHMHARLTDRPYSSWSARPR
ncbi:MAG TPA: class I SAM-dependent methyltransferase, partial [Blastocatellia bacterium]